MFQVLAQMLELHSGGVPAEYRGLLPLLLTPTAWTQKGSVPGLVKLLKAFLARDAKAMCEAGQLNQVLGVVQQRLIPSKVNDGWGFEILQAVAQYVPVCVLLVFLFAVGSGALMPSCGNREQLKANFRGIIITLLTRMQTSKTDRFVYYLVYYLSFCLAIDVNGLTPDYIVGEVEGIQSG